jgi:hypothetical protein
MRRLRKLWIQMKQRITPSRARGKLKQKMMRLGHEGDDWAPKIERVPMTWMVMGI